MSSEYVQEQGAGAGSSVLQQQEESQKEVRELARQTEKNNNTTLGKLRKWKVGMAQSVECHKENGTRKKKWEEVLRFSGFRGDGMSNIRVQLSGSQWGTGHGENQSLKNPATQLRVKRWGRLLCTKLNITKPIFTMLFLRLPLVWTRHQSWVSYVLCKVPVFFKGRMTVLAKKQKSVFPKANLVYQTKANTTRCFSISKQNPKPFKKDTVPVP